MISTKDNQENIGKIYFKFPYHQKPFSMCELLNKEKQVMLNEIRFHTGHAHQCDFSKTFSLQNRKNMWLNCVAVKTLPHSLESTAMR